ncbi:hypothetical protein ACTXT7_001404 [Hymenolepis weldensis]
MAKYNSQNIRANVQGEIIDHDAANRIFKAKCMRTVEHRFLAKFETCIEAVLTDFFRSFTGIQLSHWSTIDLIQNHGGLQISIPDFLIGYLMTGLTTAQNGVDLVKEAIGDIRKSVISTAIFTFYGEESSIATQFLSMCHSSSTRQISTNLRTIQ